MIFNSEFPRWCLIVCFFGLGLGLVASIIVLISLIKLPFKDISTELRKYSTISDIVLIAVFFNSFFARTSIDLCVEYFLYTFAYNVHVYWIFYISYVMHKIIYLKKPHDERSIGLYFVGLVLLAAGGVIALFSIAGEGICDRKYLASAFYFYIIGFLIPNIILLILILIFYRNIRNSLRAEIRNSEESMKKCRGLFIRVYGYPIIFFFTSLVAILSGVEWADPKVTSILQLIRYIIMSYYPLMNSIFYGLTQSSKRVLKFLIIKDFDYIIEQDCLNALRIENYLLPRFYLDLIDQPEDGIFS